MTVAEGLTHPWITDQAADVPLSTGAGPGPAGAHGPPLLRSQARPAAACQHAAPPPPPPLPP